MSRSPAVPEQQTNAAPPAKQAKPVDEKIGDTLTKIEDRLINASINGLDVKRLIEVVRIMVYKTPKLQECIPATVHTSVIRSATLGLELDPSMMEAYLIPRFNKEIKNPDGSKGAMECTLQIGYQGFRKLAMQSEKIKVLETRLVRENDYFEVGYNNSGLVFDHRPVFGSRGGNLLYVYAYAKLTNDEPVIEVMDMDEVEEIHRRSEGYRNSIKYNKEETGPWVSDFSEMCRKTVLKRACKSLPRSLELAQALAHDNADYSSEDTAPTAPRLSQADQLKQRLAPPKSKQINAPTAPEPVSRQSEPEHEEPADEPEDIDITPQEQAPEPVQEAPKAPVKAPEPEPAPEPVGPSDVAVWGQPDTPIDPRPYNEVVKGAVASANAELVELAIGTDMEKTPPKITEAIVHTLVHDALVAAKLAAEPKKQLMTSDKKIVISPLYKTNKDLIRSVITNGVEAQCREIKKALGIDPEPVADADINELADISEEAQGEAKE